MAQAAIDKDRLNGLIAAVNEAGRFYGPVRDGSGVSLSPLGPDDELALDYANFKLPPKRLFLPPTEVIYTYDADGLAEVPLPEDKTVVFGLRPCDAAALLCLDKVFLDEQFVDPYYRSRRDNSTIISLACARPQPTCFCTSTGAGPAAAKGADVLAFDVGEALLLESVTEKGEAFMAAHAGLMSQPTAEQTAARDAQASEAEKNVPAVELSGIAEKLQGKFDSPMWAAAAERCIGCAVCAFSCPTCHCFGLYDEKADPAGRRIRVQDTCMFPAFTSEASGHNPRDTRGQRMRQRVMHKFRYTVENFGEVFCVGCGRCITNCPVNVDIRETVAEVLK